MRIIAILTLLIGLKSITSANEKRGETLNGYGFYSSYGYNHLIIREPKGQTASITPKWFYSWEIGSVLYRNFNERVSISPELGLLFGGTLATINTNSENITDTLNFSAIIIRPIISYRPKCCNSRIILRAGLEVPLLFSSASNSKLKTPFNLMVSAKYLFRWHQDIRLAPEIRYYYGINCVAGEDANISPYMNRFSVNRIAVAFTIW